MAGWLALSRLPDRRTKEDAEEVAKVLHGDALVKVISVRDWELGEEEVQIRKQNKRMFGGTPLSDEGGEEC